MPVGIAIVIVAQVRSRGWCEEGNSRESGVESAPPTGWGRSLRWQASGSGLSGGRKRESS